MMSKMLGAWSTLKLSQRFGLAGFLVLLIAAFIIGSWVAREIERGVVDNTASTTAVYIETFVSPVAQGLHDNERLSADEVAVLDALMDPMNGEQRILSIKIWKQNGFIAYSSNPELIGQEFPVSERLRTAMAGKVSAEFDELHDLESAHEREAGLPLLEIYSPIWHTEDGEVVAVAEFYVEATQLQSELLQAQIKSWAVVGVTTLFVYILLFSIVHGGSQMIDRQQRSLERRVTELSGLRDQLRLASRRASEVNERFLRRIGGELHDGPAQLLGLAMLKLDQLQPVHGGNPVECGSTVKQNAFDTIETSLKDALTEIRGMSSGLTLPELESLTVSEVITKAIETQERRTEMVIRTYIDPLPEIVNRSINICTYRFIQEALTNAFRHSGVNQASVTARRASSQLVITVEDAGVGFEYEEVEDGMEHLGLIGLRERIQSMGGSFDIQSAAGQGTSVTATLPLSVDLAIDSISV